MKRYFKSNRRIISLIVLITFLSLLNGLSPTSLAGSHQSKRTDVDQKPEKLVEKKAEPKLNPQGPSSGDSHVYRGGCSGNEAFNIRTTFRLHLAPGWSAHNIGIRLVRE
jgi:hypothetical protein